MNDDAQVRRVKDQEEMFNLLEQNANKVYSCFKKSFPSLGVSTTRCATVKVRAFVNYLALMSHLADAIDEKERVWVFGKATHVKQK